MRQRCDASLAAGPFAGRQVVQDQAQTVSGQALGHLFAGPGVRELTLDASKPGPASRFEAIQEITLAEKQTQIGG